MLKKSLAVFLMASILLLSFFSVPAFAYESEDDFDISDYTWEDIMTMSNEEFHELLSNFERVYDPFGTYETNPLTVDNKSVQPYWTSGTEDMSEQGSHELITARACGLVLADKGFWGTTHNGSIVVALSISLASIIPDKNLLLGPLDLFKGHFYDPDTGKNFLGGSSNTASTNTNKFYQEALAEYNKNGSTEEFIEAVGKMLHYIQDASEPHHATNIIKGQNNDVHTKFEEYSDSKINSYIDSLTTLSSSSYSNAVSASVISLVNSTARTGKNASVYAMDGDDQTNWDRAAYSTTRSAVQYSAMLLYKLSVQANIPLTK